LYAHVPREQDEMELLIGDFIFITQEEWSKTSDGWVVGISWLTGSTGYLPTNYVERTAETNAWTLHSVVPFNRERNLGLETSETMGKPAPAPVCDSNSINNIGSDTSLERLVGAQEADSRSAPDLEVESLYAKVVRHSRESPPGHGSELEFEARDREDETVSSSTPTRPPGPRQLFITRHGERVDFTFGPWIPYSFDKEGRYQRKDLNMPSSVPARRDGPEGFSRDCPLTVVGSLQARMVGEAMRDAGTAIHHVFCSPSLRCVQTCHGILSGLGIADKLKINIEPGLFEWLAWYQDEMPSWMTAQELISAGYNVEPSYKPYISSEELHDTVQETCGQFFIRNFFITQCALQATEEAGGNVLLIGHAATLDTCSRQLVGGEPRQVNELMSIVRKVPYCSVAMLEEVVEEDELLSGRGSPTPSSRLGGAGRSSPGCVSSMSLMSRSTLASTSLGSMARTPAPPPPRTWRIAQPPFPPMTHTSVNTFDWKLLLDKE